MFNRIFNRSGGEGENPNRDSPYRGRPIGRVLTKMGKVNREQVVEGLTMQKSRGGKLGENLVALGYVSAEDVDEALRAQRGE